MLKKKKVVTCKKPFVIALTYFESSKKKVWKLVRNEANLPSLGSDRFKE